MKSAETEASVTQSEPLPHQRFQPIAPARARCVPSAYPLGFLGMLVLILGVESFVILGGPRFLDPVAFSWSWSASAAVDKAPGSDILVLGDSLAKHGLVPRVIEEATGRIAYNLAVAAGPVPVTQTILRRALDSGAKPSAIIFDLKPGMMVGGPRYATRYWPQVLSFPELLGLARMARSGLFTAELFTGLLLPSYRSRHEIRGEIMAALRNETGPLRAINSLCRRNWSVNQGANLATRRPAYQGIVTESEHEEHLSSRFSAHRVNAEYARRLVAMAATHNIKTYLIIPPFVPEIQSRRYKSGSAAKYTLFVKSLQDRFPGLTVLDASDSSYPASVFVDPIHLDAGGAVALSADLADILQRDLNNPKLSPQKRRWISLPPYRRRSLPAEIEDVETSRERLDAADRR